MMLLWAWLLLSALVVVIVALGIAAYRWGFDAGQLGERAVWLEREAARRDRLRAADRLPPVEWLHVADFKRRAFR